ncbi:prepilin-type N-terminal cleavage/methylation domain-containing protein [Weizmannia sp. FSL W8-1119]|uniref:prepilin-type N-terminal cleavage/methylation domain-containing protein n=1 Tax=Weizmannia sp. FSL W8-1119 TaxID=2954709 RepID=UPI0030F6F2E5
MLHKKRKLLKNQKGLTLIELLAVIVILGIIAAIAIPAIGNVIKNSRFNAIKSDAIQVISAAKLYVSDNGVKSPLSYNDLKPYIDDQDSKLKTSDNANHPFSVSVSTNNSDGKTVYKFTGYGEDGDVKIKFNDADLKTINTAKRSDINPDKDGVYTIGQ